MLSLFRTDDLVDSDSAFFALNVPFTNAHELAVFGHIDVSDRFHAFAPYTIKAVKFSRNFQANDTTG